ncbi:unnamed protein product, partial [Ectocarpus sp. 13 AM-2016]
GGGDGKGVVDSVVHREECSKRWRYLNSFFLPGIHNCSEWIARRYVNKHTSTNSRHTLPPCCIDSIAKFSLSVDPTCPSSSPLSQTQWLPEATPPPNNNPSLPPRELLQQ